MKCCIIISIYKNDTLNQIKEALESLYNQTLKADIFIKIDGIINKEIEKFLDESFKNKQIYYLDKREPNKGLAISLNELLTKVLALEYTYIFRMDADDICNKDRIKLQINFMEQNKEVDICGTFIEEFGDGIDYNKIVKYPLTHNEMFKFFSKRVPLAHVSVCFRNSFFQKAGLYPTKGHITNEDSLLWLMGFKHNCIFANIDYIGVKVRVSKNFFNRRGSLKKIFFDFQNRLLINKELDYGIKGNIFAIGMLIINILPPSIKKLAYKYLRN